MHAWRDDHQGWSTIRLLFVSSIKNLGHWLYCTGPVLYLAICTICNLNIHFHLFSYVILSLIKRYVKPENSKTRFVFVCYHGHISTSYLLSCLNSPWQNFTTKHWPITNGSITGGIFKTIGDSHHQLFVINMNCWWWEYHHWFVRTSGSIIITVNSSYQPMVLLITAALPYQPAVNMLFTASLLYDAAVITMAQDNKIHNLFR